MKKVVLAVALAIMVGLPAMSFAAGTTTVSVSATVVGTCKFNTGGSVSFTLDPSVGGNVSGTVTQPQFWCTKNATYTITDDYGLNENGTIRRMTNGTDFIPYSFSYTSTGTGQGKNSPITMDITAQVQEADYVDAPAGTYTDTVTLTINP